MHPQAIAWPPSTRTVELAAKGAAVAILDKDPTGSGATVTEIEGSGGVATFFDGLRSDPRFIEMLRGIGLAP